MRPDDTAPDGAVLIPLRRRDGSVAAHAVVDAADADFINQWRWHLGAWGYAERTKRLENGRTTTIKMHRELLGLSRESSDAEGDHIDRDTLNNRRANLRAVTRTGNAQNIGNRRGTRSQYRGVSWFGDTRKWRARITVDGKVYSLGLFESELEAAEAARAARERLMPYAID